jgi:hypothetical protein
MGFITDERVSEVNDAIAQAPTTAAAFRIVDGLTRTMIDRLIDLNGTDPGSLRGYGMAARRDWVADAHGWHASERDDDTPADGRGPCSLGQHEPHSRRPWECRGCKRRRIDHRHIHAGRS